VSVSPAGRAGRPEGFILVATDVTVRWRGEDAVRSRAEEELRQANEQLRQLDQRKTEFMNAIAHELRTPLTPIMMQLEFLKTSPRDPERQQRSFEVLSRSMGRLNALVDQLLDVARLQRGGLPPGRPIDLGAVVEDASEIFSDLAKDAGLSLDIDLDEGLRADADADAITQVVTNLLSNALKFTPRGGRLAVRAFEKEGQCVVRVQDSGVGLTPEQAGRLFAPFIQVHGERRAGGSGLGLFISKGIVERYGGTIWVESDGPGRGTTFTFSLPVSAKAGRAGREREGEGPPGSRRGPSR
jgi:signal transduction histidine kinase